MVGEEVQEGRNEGRLVEHLKKIDLTLHVGAMELHQLDGLLTYEGLVVHELFHERVAQEVRILLDDLDLGPFGEPRGRGF